jgi:hypothetical protein
VLQVLGHRQLEVQAPGLKDDAGLLPRLVRFAGHIEALIRPSAGGHHQRRKDAEQGRLAAAIGTQQAEDLRRLYGKAQVVERQPVAVVMGEAVELDGHRLRDAAGPNVRRGMFAQRRHGLSPSGCVQHHHREQQRQVDHAGPQQVARVAARLGRGERPGDAGKANGVGQVDQPQQHRATR